MRTITRLPLNKYRWRWPMYNAVRVPRLESTPSTLITTSLPSITPAPLRTHTITSKRRRTTVAADSGTSQHDTATYELTCDWQEGPSRGRVHLLQGDREMRTIRVSRSPLLNILFVSIGCGPLPATDSSLPSAENGCRWRPRSLQETNWPSGGTLALLGTPGVVPIGCDITPTRDGTLKSA
ncbi:hypothetical protein BOTBODRAFT_348815 [Botryobasidium botryosum FD-172 SS1]|uniref:Uncharacterized protein n=1 Tax=Botryobasidium botryosum (strain FD-172 SS1) TaxID=930990 RepID=A0A067MR70_BOTB1|nr:hypothetical protein BOTBODRAFT_348815 [Botryobasidium botryosum FD-172 SS1]